MYACAQFAVGFEHMLRSRWHISRPEKTMKRSALHNPKKHELPLAWREAEFAALQANAADTCDDRVSENIFDLDDERAEVDVIVHRMAHDVN